MKKTGICKSDAVVKDGATMKTNPNDSAFFLKDIIGNGCFLNSNYQTMIADMFKHFHDKYEAKNDEVFKKKINEELKATDFTDNANTNLKIDANNNNECTYFEKKTVPAPSCWDKFAAIITKINAIGYVPMTAVDATKY